MDMPIRKASNGFGAVLAAAAVALLAATGAGASSSAVIIGGIGAGSMGDLLMAPLLGGALRNQERVNVAWPARAGPMTGKGDLTLGASIKIGTTNLTAAINTALGKLSRDANGNAINGEKVTVVGLSAGTLVVDEVLRTMVASGQVTDPRDITFILAEDSSRQKLIKDSSYNRRFDYTYHLPPVVPYDVVVITGEYDGLADLPDRPWNRLAMMNAMAGAIFVHVPVMYSDLSTVPTENITVAENSSGGTTTHYLVPTTTLPLVQLKPRLKSQEAELRIKIDQGYSRNDPVPAASARPVVVADPEVTAPSTADSGSAVSVIEAEPVEKIHAAARRDARAEAKAARAESRERARAERMEARAEAKADAAAEREARRAARAGRDSSPNEAGSSESSGASE